MFRDSAEHTTLPTRRAPVRHVRVAVATLTIAAFTMTLGACASNGVSSASVVTPGAGSPSQGGLAAGGESNVTVWTVSSANKAPIGDYLVAESTTGGDALTVYVYKKDIPGSGSSACDLSCSRTWPPLLLEDAATVRASGVSGKLGQLTRSDGTVQVTYNGAPLYFYLGDHGAGDTNGQGLNASWVPATP